MNIAAIVAEYNPFHNGHAFQIQKTRQAGATHVVAVMGGNYLQRGEPACMEKHARVKAALLGGADLVLELPLPRAMATAERFAEGAIHLIRSLGCVDLVSFGAEDQLEDLRILALVLACDDLAPKIRGHLRFGRTFAAARQMALTDVVGSRLSGLLATPNNILGVEYMKAAVRMGFTPKFHAVLRRGVRHDSRDASGKFASASHLRALLRADGVRTLPAYVPPEAYAVYREAERDGLVPVPGGIESSMLPVLRRLSSAECGRIPELSEGLENRFYSAIRSAVSLEELFQTVKTKRYPMSRIRRMAWNAYLGVTDGDARSLPPYLRVLGFNRAGMEILSRAKTTATLPLSSSLAQLERENETCARFARLEARSTDLYTLGMPMPRPCGYDYTCKPVLLK